MRGSVWSWILSGPHIPDHYERHSRCRNKGRPAHLPLGCCCTEREQVTWVYRYMKVILPLVFISLASPLSAFKCENAALGIAFMVARSLVYSTRRYGWSSPPLISPHTQAWLQHVLLGVIMTLSGAGDSIGCFCGFVICVKLLHVHIIKIQTL